MIGMMVIDVFPSSIQILPHLFLWSELQINILARTPTTHNSQHTKTNDIAANHGRRRCPYDHLPMVLRS